MQQNPYAQFRGKDLTLNDLLAIDRTILSNERTLLAYARTGLALAIVGGTCIQFFESRTMMGVGVVFIAAGVVLGARGWQRYRRMQAYMGAALDVRTGTSEHPMQAAVDAGKEGDGGPSGPNAIGEP